MGSYGLEAVGGAVVLLVPKSQSSAEVRQRRQNEDNKVKDDDVKLDDDVNK